MIIQYKTVYKTSLEQNQTHGIVVVWIEMPSFMNGILGVKNECASIKVMRRSPIISKANKLPLPNQQ